MKRAVFFRTFLMGIISIPFLSFKPFRKKNCLTDSDVEGPFFRTGAPTRTNLAKEYNGEGTPLVVEGKIYGQNCSEPVPNATIDIWHASPEGQYDLNSKKYLFRGKLTTNSAGFYRFESLMPKGYRDGGMDRPKHIHYKVSAENHHKLITQLYFLGDEKMAKDPFVIRNKGYKRARKPIVGADGSLKISFDVFLKTKRS